MDDFTTYQVFNPHDYLDSYYRELGSEAEGLLRFLSSTFANLPDNISVLEFGGGPTVISLLCAARKASEILFCDYVESNRAVVERWLSGDESDFDWTPYTARTLQLEGVAQPTAAQIQARAQRVRETVTAVLPCDIYQTPPVAVDRKYDAIITNYCLDAVTSDKAEWHRHIRNLRSLLVPGGTFMMASLQEARYSNFGETRYPNVYLQASDVAEALVIAGFVPASIRVSSAPADHQFREYSGVIFASAIEF